MDYTVATLITLLALVILCAVIAIRRYPGLTLYICGGTFAFVAIMALKPMMLVLFIILSPIILSLILLLIFIASTIALIRQRQSATTSIKILPPLSFILLLLTLCPLLIQTFYPQWQKHKLSPILSEGISMHAVETYLNSNGIQYRKANHYCPQNDPCQRTAPNTYIEVISSIPFSYLPCTSGYILDFDQNKLIRYKETGGCNFL